MEKIKEITDIKIGDFVKVEDTTGLVVDRLNFSGQVFQKYDGIVEVRTFNGIIGLKWDDDTFSTVWYKLNKKPSGWDKFIKNPKKFKAPKEQPSPELLKTKKELIFDMVKNNPRKKSPGLLKLAKETIGGDDTILSTYIQLAITKIR